MVIYYRIYLDINLIESVGIFGIFIGHLFIGVLLSF